MRRFLRITALCAISSTLTLAMENASEASYDHRERPQAAVCAEDEPCWTWSTMGSLTRGVVVTSGTPRGIGVKMPRAILGKGGRRVTPCQFAFLAHEGRLSRKTKRLKGDRWAMAHGCDFRYYG